MAHRWNQPTLILSLLIGLSACSKKAADSSSSSSSAQNIEECTFDCTSMTPTPTPTPPSSESANSISSLLKGRANAPSDGASLKLTVQIGQQIHFVDSQKFYSYDISKNSFLAPTSNGNQLSTLFKGDPNAPTDFVSLRYSFNYGDFSILCTSSRWYAFNLKSGRFYSSSELGLSDNLISTAWKNDSKAPNPADVLTAFTYPVDKKYVVFLTASHYFLFNQSTGKFETSNTLASVWGKDSKAPTNLSQIKLSFVVGNNLFLLDSAHYYQFDFSLNKFVQP